MSGWIARFMPVFRLPSEEALFVKPTWTRSPAFIPLYNQGVFEYVARVTTPDPKLLPTTVVYGDSFFDGMLRSGFDAYFQNLCHARVSHGLKLSGIARSLPPDAGYLVVEFIEVTTAVLQAFADKADLALATEIIESRR
jgi:hypothetical protein